jgi:aspartokinase/homoserine dehydrogenase 1
LILKPQNVVVPDAMHERSQALATDASALDIAISQEHPPAGVSLSAQADFPSRSVTLVLPPRRAPRRRSVRARNALASKKPLKVMKFGGTSVGDACCIEKTLEIVRGSLGDYRVLVVVSAMAGVTDLLLEAAMCAAAGDSETVARIFKSLKARHRSTANALIGSAAKRGRLNRQLKECFVEGESLCQELLLTRSLTAAARDLISSLGERLSAPLVATALTEVGVKSEAVDARECLVTDSHHGAANPSFELTRGRCERRLRPLLQKEIVPVVTGFLGATAEGALTTLGRGGSDYSASILGVVLDAQEVIIWTDVNGFLTSDPRLVPEASTIPQISYQHAAALAYFGAKVLHPKTLQPVIQRGIPVWIRNTFAPEQAGTKITLHGPHSDVSVKALAAMSDIQMIAVTVSGMEESSSVTHRAFAAVAAARSDILMTAQTRSTCELGFVVRSPLAERTMEALQMEFGSDADRRYIREIGVKNGVALVTVVGQHLRDLPGIAEQAFAALCREKLQVIASSQGASDCNLSFVVAAEDMERTLGVLHKEFQLDGVSNFR